MAHTFSKAELRSEEYRIERIEAYNVAIEALRNHESMSEENTELSRRLRENLADKLERELMQWRIAHDC